MCRFAPWDRYIALLPFTTTTTITTTTTNNTSTRNDRALREFFFGKLCVASGIISLVPRFDENKYRLVCYIEPIRKIVFYETKSWLSKHFSYRHSIASKYYIVAEKQEQMDLKVGNLLEIEFLFRFLTISRIFDP